MALFKKDLELIAIEVAEEDKQFQEKLITFLNTTLLKINPKFEKEKFINYINKVKWKLNNT